MSFSASRAWARSACRLRWAARVSSSSSRAARTARAPAAPCSRRRRPSAWPSTQVRSSARSARPSVSEWHSASSSSTNSCRRPNKRRTRWQTSATALASTGVAPSCATRAARVDSSSASSAARGSPGGRPAHTVVCKASMMRGWASPRAGDAVRSPAAAAAALGDAGTSGGTAGASADSTASTSSSGWSLSHALMSCFSRCCSRCASLRLPSSTRCRLSFLRAPVQWRAPRSRPLARRSISWAQAAPWPAAAAAPRSNARWRSS